MGVKKYDRAFEEFNREVQRQGLIPTEVQV